MGRRVILKTSLSPFVYIKRQGFVASVLRQGDSLEEVRWGLDRSLPFRSRLIHQCAYLPMEQDREVFWHSPVSTGFSTGCS